MYSNSYCSYKFAPKQEKNGQSSHKEYSNNILKYLEFTAIINACTKKVWKLIECTSYIGASARHLTIRAGEHLNVSKSGKSAIKEHIRKCSSCKTQPNNMKQVEIIRKCQTSY